VNRLPMSTAAAALFRALLGRTSVERDRILLTEYRSVDWQSLTFVGERHEFRFRMAGPGAEEFFEAFTADLGEADFALPGHVVVDIALLGAMSREGDGSIAFGIEALTIVDD
jgi:hypothetical protein